MKKRVIAILIMATMMLCALPVGSFAATKNVSKDDKAVLYTPNSDYRDGDCILSATKTMIRRAAIMRGSKLWSKTTNKAIRKDATIFGLLLHNFSHSTDGLKYTVKVGEFRATTEKGRIKEFQKLIKSHPEGVVVWGKHASIYGQHGILLTGVKNGQVYAVDSVYNKGRFNVGVQKWQDTTMYSPLKCTQYWYIKQISIAKGAKAPAKGQPLKPTSATSTKVGSTLRLVDASQPSQVNYKSGYPVEGVVESNYRISDVKVQIINSSGKIVIKQHVKPNTWSYNLSKIDSKIKFGTLAEGKYRYKITAKDEKKYAVLMDANFSVINPKTTSTLKITGYTYPTKVKQGKPFVLQGAISSNQKITKVTIKIVDSSGKSVIRATDYPNKKSTTLAKLDPKITFGKLKKGNYKYQVIATDKLKTKTLVNRAFSVI